jgi:hypothetical protein
MIPPFLTPASQMVAAGRTQGGASLLYSPVNRNQFYRASVRRSRIGVAAQDHVPGTETKRSLFSHGLAADR